MKYNKEEYVPIVPREVSVAAGVILIGTWFIITFLGLIVSPLLWVIHL